MATIWQWQGDATDGAGYIRILSGSSSVPITGTVTLASGSATIGVISGTVTLASGSATIGVISGTVTLASGSATIGVISGSVTLSGSNFEQAPGSAIPTKGVLMGISDGTNLRAMSGNLEGTLLASAARTGTTISSAQTNYNARALIVTLDVTAASGTGGLQVFVRGRSASGKVYDLNAAPTARTTTGTQSYEIGLGVGTVASSGIPQRTAGSIPRSFDVVVLHGDGSSYTYSVEYSLQV